MVEYNYWFNMSILDIVIGNTWNDNEPFVWQTGWEKPVDKIHFFLFYVVYSIFGLILTLH